MSNPATMPRFSNLQLMLLELYAREVSEEDLSNINHIVGQYFMDKLSQKATLIAQKKGWTEQNFLDILNDPNQ